MNARTIAALILVGLVACTSGSDEAGGPENATETAPPSSPAEGTDANGNSNGGEPSGGGGGEAPERSTTTVGDRANDATSSGDVDGYPELSKATVEGSNEGVMFVLGFARAVPEETPTGVRMTLALSLIDAEGNRFLLNALGSEQGWTATAVTSEGQVNFGGLFEIAGQKVRIGIPWSDLGGPRPFNWIVSSSWTGNPKKGTSYAFDSIPNRGFEGFPETD